MMKRNDSDGKKIRDALEACYSQIDDKPSLEHEILWKIRGGAKVKKKITLRSILVTALLILLAVGVAIGATSQSTLHGHLTRWFDSPVPQAAQKVLDQSAKKTYTLGGVEFTIQQSIADGNIAHVFTTVQALEDDVILYPIPMDELMYEIHDYMKRSITDGLVETYGGDYSMNLLELAQEKQMKIYGVAVDFQSMKNKSDETVAYAYTQDAGLALDNRIWHRAGEDQQNLDINYHYYVTEYDTLTGEPIAQTALSDVDVVTVPIQPTLGVRTFTARDNQISNGTAYVQSMVLTHKVTGVYVQTNMMIEDETITKELLMGDSEKSWDIHGLLRDDFVLLDDAGKQYPEGMSLYATTAPKDFPIFVRENMVSMDAMPDHLNIGILGEDGETIVATYTITDYTDEKLN